MTKKALGSALAGLVVFNAGLPSLGMQPPWANATALGVAVAIAAITRWLQSDTSTPLP